VMHRLWNSLSKMSAVGLCVEKVNPRRFIFMS
jgi:hypothetical protein